MNKCTIIEMGIKNGHFTRNYFIESKELKNNLNKYDGDIYSTIYKYDSTDQNTANYIAPLYLDLDIDDIEINFLKVKQDLLLVMRRLKTVFNLSDKDIELYFSGSKGFHILVSHTIFGFEPSRNINKQYKNSNRFKKHIQLINQLILKYMIIKDYSEYLIQLIIKQDYIKYL